MPWTLSPTHPSIHHRLTHAIDRLIDWLARPPLYYQEMVECIETYDDRLKTEGQLLLNACLELERPPRHACFFDFSAIGIDAAHDNDMRVRGGVDG